MKKALKQLIENAEVKMVGEFRSFLMIPNGIYDGFYGKNGYDNILLLGRSVEDDKWYKIADSIDALHLFYPPSLNWEIDSRYGVPSFWSNLPIGIYYDGMTSSIIACAERKEERIYAPSADAVERKKGKFIWVDGVRCSECNHKLQSTGLPSFCPNCGAEMER